MVFSGLTFLFCFLPAVLLLYYAAPRAAKNTVLFLASLFFYAWGEPVYVVLMIFSTVLDYTCGRMVEHFRGTRLQKAGLVLSLCGNLGLLLTFKYTGFFIETVNSLFSAGIPKPGWTLPIGISFYTFQTMSYTIDVYRGDVKAQRNFIAFGAYVSLFPQLIAGPIVRYRDIAEQLEGRIHSADSFAEGARRFVTGLAKKVLLANNIGKLHNTLTAVPLSGMTTLSAWLAALAFAFQIYFDFSGYSDMAIGLGKMFGFSFPENFNYPYLAASVTDFWRRWHITLGSWFKDYVYIPLGGNRCRIPRRILNIAVVWLLTGFWHGASLNFIMWGAWYGALLILEKFLLLPVFSRLPDLVRKPLSRIYTLLAVLIGWVFFSLESVSDGFMYLKVMFCGGTAFTDNATMYSLLSFLPLLLLCILGSTPLPANVLSKLRTYAVGEPVKAGTLQTGTGLVCRKHRMQGIALTAAELTGITIITALSVAYLISGSYNPFLYFRF
jgi:alginate O-acetyltransferase complex protein AlgI